jgi:C4-dicarboxylate transporter
MQIFPTLHVRSSTDCHVHGKARSFSAIAHMQVTSLLDRRDANGRYIALEALAAVAAAPDIAAALRPHLPLISACLSDADPSVRKRTVNVLVTLCSAETVAQIADQLLEHLALRSLRECLLRREIGQQRISNAFVRVVGCMIASSSLALQQRRCPLWMHKVM